MHDDALELIHDRSRAGYAGEPGIVSRLLRAGWCEEEDLLRGYQRLSESDTADCVVFLELPFHVRLPAKWIPFKWSHGHPVLHFRTRGVSSNRLIDGEPASIGHRTSFADMEPLQNAYLPGDITGQIVRSQVLLTLQLWGFRKHAYEDYLSAVNREDLGEIITRRTPSYWAERTAITAEAYESEVADRLQREAHTMLAHFVPIYAVSAADPFAVMPRYLSSFFVMMRTGRLVTRGPGRTMLAQAARPFEFADHSRNLANLLENIETKRTVTVYERYLLETMRQVEIGSPTLAVVQSVMVVEWFANEIINNQIVRALKRALPGRASLIELLAGGLFDGRTRLPDKVNRYLTEAGVELPAPLKQQLTQLIQLRNRLIHREQARQVEAAEARRAVLTALAVVDRWMSCLLSRDRGQVPANT